MEEKKRRFGDGDVRFSVLDPMDATDNYLAHITAKPLVAGSVERLKKSGLKRSSRKTSRLIATDGMQHTAKVDIRRSGT